MKTKLILILLVFLSCNSQKKEKKDDNNVKDAKPSSETFHENGKIKSQFYKNYETNKNVQLNFDENEIITSKIINFNGQPLTTFLYKKGKIDNMYIEDNVNGCLVKVKNEYFYDSSGNITKSISYLNNLQKKDSSCDELFIVKTIKEFYVSDKLKSINYQKTFYEAGNDCPCGNWIFYDKIGKIIKNEKYNDCLDFNLDCGTNNTEGFLIKLKLAFDSGKINLEDWIGQYKFDNNNFEQGFREYTISIDKRKCFIYAGSQPACEIIGIPSKNENQIDFYYDSQLTDRSTYSYELVEKSEHGDLIFSIYLKNNKKFVKSPLVKYWKDDLSDYKINQEIELIKN